VRRGDLEKALHLMDNFEGPKPRWAPGTILQEKACKTQYKLLVYRGSSDKNENWDFEYNGKIFTHGCFGIKHYEVCQPPKDTIWVSIETHANLGARDSIQDICKALLELKANQ
jgi:hypothetical protein